MTKITQRELIENLVTTIHQLIEVLRYARKHKTPGHFSWQERVWVHRYNARLFKIIDLLEDGDLDESPSEAALSKLRELREEFRQGPEKLILKLLEIREWIDLKN